MASLSEVFVPVRPDTDGFEPDLRRKLARVDASKSGKQVATRFGVGMHGAIGSIVSKSAGIFAAGFAAVKTVQVFGGFINDARESEKVSRITANAIRATGGAAKISADDVGKLSTAISNKTAIDDEQIQTAANMLLTFKNIRNEAGKGNDIFNQATQAAADLSVQFGGMDGASKQLGKALNDPIKGTTALAKAGVTFTQQQKDQIKTLVESGNTLGAQKIILAEIQGQVGGAAAAAADPMERLKVIAGNLGESIGGLLLPTVNRFANFISDEVVPGLSAFAAAFKANDGDITSSGFPGFMEKVGFAARQAFDYFKTNVLPRLREFAGVVRDEVVPRIRDVAVYLAQTLGPVIREFVESRLAALKKIFGQVRQSIADNRPQLEQLGRAILNVAKFVIEKLIPFLSKVSGTTMPVLGTAISRGIRTVAGLVTAFNAIKEPIRVALRFVTNAFLGVVGTILDGAERAFGWVPNLGDKLKGAAKDFRKFRDDVNRALDGVDDEAVRVSLFTSKAPGGHVPIERASGGPVFGPGTSTSDSINARLSKGEHVLSAREVIGAGGHAAVAAMRSVWAKASRFARGGPVGLNVRDTLPGFGAISSLTRGIARDFGREIARQREALGVNPGLNGVLDFVRSQVGKPYVWGGVGPGGYDCSGLVSAAINRAFGRKPYSRLGATGSMPWGMMAPGPGAFMVGWFKGNPGHTAATVNKVNIESAGGVGVRMGAAARGASNSLFTNRMHVKGFARGGAVEGDLPYDLLKGDRDLLQALGFDRGGYLPTGVSVVQNKTGKPEPLTRTDQEMRLDPASIKAIGKAMAQALRETPVRLVSTGGGAYILQASNG